MAKGKYRNKRLAAEQAAQEPQQTAAQPPEDSPEDGAPTPITDNSTEAEKLKRLIELDFEKQAAQGAAGQEEKTYGIWGPIWRLMEWYNKRRVPHTFKKKTYLWLMLFTGWFGGHRWYQGRRWLGLIETCIFWTGVPVIMLVTDFMEVWPIQADEQGFITMR